MQTLILKGILKVSLGAGIGDHLRNRKRSNCVISIRMPGGKQIERFGEIKQDVLNFEHLKYSLPIKHTWFYRKRKTFWWYAVLNDVGKMITPCRL